MFYRFALTIAVAAGFLASPFLVTDASAKFKPFQCAAAVNKCVKSVKALPSIIKKARKACQEFRNCKKKCRVDKKACNKSIRDNRGDWKTLGKGTGNWLKRICKKAKYGCKEQCVIDYKSVECTNARADLGNWLLTPPAPPKGKKAPSAPPKGKKAPPAPPGSKKAPTAPPKTSKNSKGLAACMKTLSACIPGPIASCTTGIYTLAADNKSTFKKYGASVKANCKQLKSCKNECLLIPSRKGFKKCKKNCRAQLNGKKCKTARKKLLSVLKKQATDKTKRKGWFNAVKSCSSF